MTGFANAAFLSGVVDRILRSTVVREAVDGPLVLFKGPSSPALPGGRAVAREP